MRQKIARALSTLLLVCAPTIALPATAFAACPTDNSSKAQVLKGVGQAGSDCEDKGVTSTLAAVVNILSYITGIAAVIMIMVAGFKYVISNGDSGRIGSAKSTLIYALVGLAVVALAQFLVHFVLYRTHA